MVRTCVVVFAVVANMQVRGAVGAGRAKGQHRSAADKFEGRGLLAVITEYIHG